MTLYLDVDVLYALLKENDFHRPYARKIMSSKEKKYTSVIALLELEIIVKREMSDELSLRLHAWAREQLPGVHIANCTSEQFQKSLELWEKHGLGIFDSLHAAICLAGDGEIASTDHIYDRVPGLKRVK